MKVFWAPAALLIATSAVAACGGSDDCDDGDPAAAAAPQAETPSPSDSPENAPAGPPPSADAANDDQQADAPTAELVFERREIVSYVGGGDEGTRKGSVTVAIPVGWDQAPGSPGVFRLPDDSLGSQFSVGSTCGGSCIARTAAEWAALTAAGEFGQFRDTENFTVELEEELADGRLLVATNSFGVTIVDVARWIGGRTEYFYCRFFTPDADALPIAPFERACRDAAIDDLPDSARG